MKKNYILLLMLSLLLTGISCDTDKLVEELEGADNIVVPDYDGIFAFPIGSIEYTVDSLLANAGDDLEYYTNSDGVIVFRFSEGDTVDIDEELGEQPDLDFDVELIQTLEVPAISFAIDFFEEFSGGKFEVKSPKLSFNFNNTLQIPSSLRFLKFQAVKYDENGVLLPGEDGTVDLEWLDPADSLQSINTPTRLDTEERETLDIYLDETNSNLRKMLSIQPDSLTMEIGFVAFPDVPDTVIYFDIDTLGPYIVNVDTVNVTTVDADGDGFPDLDGSGDPILNIDTVLFNLGNSVWNKNPQGNEPYGTDAYGNVTGYNQKGERMAMIPDSTEIIPIYVATGEQILEATTGTEQDGVPGIITFDDLEVVFNTSTGRVEEGKEEYITTNLSYSHPDSDYKLLDTVFVGTDLTGIDPKAIQDPTSGDIAWAIAITRYTAVYGLNSGAIIVSDVVMELPVEINLTNLTVTQEIDFDGGDDIKDLIDELEDNNQNIPEVEIRLTAVNELPLGVSVNMHFLDASDVSLNSEEDQLIDPPTLTADGSIVASTSTYSIILDTDAIEALKTTETIQLILSLNTADSEFLPLLESAKVNITLSIKVTN
jgi:hypothetical protein